MHASDTGGGSALVPCVLTIVTQGGAFGVPVVLACEGR
jgi:hypothetical protein